MMQTAPETAPPAAAEPSSPAGSERPDLLNSLAFLGVHLGALMTLRTGVSAKALAAAVVLYWARMFAITGGYHRYFSHRSFRTGRAFQFFLAFLGGAAGQKGALWWAAHHRRHHLFSDKEGDIHSPVLRGLWWSHAGWILSSKYDATDFKAVPDLARYPELVWLDRHYIVPPFALALALYAWGGAQMLAWGFFVSTVVLYHGTFVINSLAHVLGTRRFDTGDFSRNNLWLALITMGEGWHNNHHRYPGSERQGFYWWEIDVTHYLLRGLSRIGVVWDLRVPPREVYAEAARASVLV